MSNYEKKIKKNIEKQKNPKKELSASTKQMRSLAKIFAAVTIIIILVAALTYFLN